MVARAAAASDPGARCQRAAGECQRDAVAGQRGDHRGLIAESEQPGWIAPVRGMDIAIRQPSNRKRPLEQCTGAGEPLAQMRTFDPSARPAGCSIVRRRRAASRRATVRTALPDPTRQAAIRHSRRRTGSVRHGGAAPQAATRRACNTSSIPPGRCRGRAVAHRATRACRWRGTRYRRAIDRAHRTPVAATPWSGSIAPTR